MNALDPDYYNSAVERLKAEKAQMTFFDNAPIDIIQDSFSV